ncbi:MAG: hypothetical protein K1X53_03540 [Candidatus Sumerlaeaceae bacterium]|nr:hypothetical protein [Candidatus Sumerlaeaceae bacterium]
MKKPETEHNDWLKDEYKRRELGKLTRGKYSASMRASTNIIVLDPQVAKAFPNDKAVNSALRSLMRTAVPPPPTRKRAKSVPAPK